jgi:hypothetical protein
MSSILSVTSSTELIIYFTNGEPVFAEGGEIPEAEMSEEDRGAETGTVEEEDMEPTETVSGAVTTESNIWEGLFDLSQTQD